MPSKYIVKKLVRARDENRCTNCGMSEEKHQRRFGRALEVHRKQPGSTYTVEGCVLLCRPCHRGTPGSPYCRISKDFKVCYFVPFGGNTRAGATWPRRVAMKAGLVLTDEDRRKILAAHAAYRAIRAARMGYVDYVI